MTFLDTALDPRAPSFLDNRSTALAALSALDAAHNQAREGGGEREVTRHHARGKLLPRERIELLIDRDTALLELAASFGQPAGAGVVTAIGIVEQAICMIVGNDPTVQETGLTPGGLAKVARAADLAKQYTLPLIFLWETSAEARQMTAPGLCVIFGAFTEPPLADHTIMVRGHGDPVNADAVADDERDALRLMRQAVRRLVPSSRPRLRQAATPPRHEADDLLAVGRGEIHEVLARILDDSAFDEFRAHRASALITGFGCVHGHPVAVLGNCSAQVDGDAVQKGLELIRQARLGRVPLLIFGGPSAPAQPALSRALAAQQQITILLGPEPPEFALAHPGFRFTWPSLGATCYDGVIDPRDTRTVLGICLSVLEGLP